MLTWIKPSGFKSFGGSAGEIRLGPLTLLVGANATGKSNLLEMVRVFQGLAVGFPIIEVVHGVQRGGHEVWPGIRGGVAEMIHRGGDSVRLQLGMRAGGDDWEYGFDLSRSPGSVNTVPDIHEEWLLNKTKNRGVLLELLNGEGELSIIDAQYRVSRPEAGGRLPDEASLDTARSNLLHPSARNLEYAGIDPAPIREFLARSRVLDLVPAHMRDYAQRSARQLGSGGENLSAVLWQLVERGGFKQDLLDWVSELCAPRIRDIDFVQIQETGDVMLQLVEQGGMRITAKAASDGTLRFLGLIAALWTVPADSLICLEEVERGLHPSRIDLLMELLVQVVRERNIQIIATTHSPRVLHALGQSAPEHLGNAVVFGRPPDGDGTITRSLRDLPAFEYALEQRGIEVLFTTQWLEIAM